VRITDGTTATASRKTFALWANFVQLGVMCVTDPKWSLHLDSLRLV